jgi:RHS repeat-associated protein
MRESGLDLYRCGLRFYDVANARWLTRDPIGYDGGQNLYGYVAGNPVMGADPLGTDDDELSDADILHIGGGRNFRPGMHAGTCRSNTAKQMMRDLNQTLILTVASGTAAGVGQMAGPVAEGLATESSIVGGKSILSGITNAWNRFLRSLKSPFDIFGTVKNLHSPETIPQLMQDMRTPGAFEYGELRGQIAGYHVDGKYFVTEGHHRVTAAIKVWIADGNAEPLSNLIKNGVWSSGRAPRTSYRFPLK